MADYLDVPTAIDEVFKGYGSNDAQRGDAVLVLAKDFAVNSGAIIHKATGLPIDDPKIKDHYTRTKPHLLPPKFEPSEADLAFLGTGNKTAASRLVAELGLEAATHIAATYGKSTPWDTKPGTRPSTDDAGKKPDADAGKNNPFSNHWSNVDPKTGRFNARAMTRQSEICKALGPAKSAELARAVGVTLGATRPRAA